MGIWGAEARWDDTEENNLTLDGRYDTRAEIEFDLARWRGGEGIGEVFLHYDNQGYRVRWVDSWHLENEPDVMEITCSTTGAIGRGSTLAELLDRIDNDELFIDLPNPQGAVEFIDSEEDLDLDDSDED